MSVVQDRPYQRGFVHGDDRHPGVIPSWQAGNDSVLGLLPTGCGKTVCAAMVALFARDHLNRRTLYLAGREVLVNQGEETLSRFGLSTGIEMGDQKVGDHSLFFGGGDPDVCVATVQTLQGRRLQKRGKKEFGVIITDECHHAVAPTFGRIYDYFQDYYHLGITATGDRGDQKNLGRVYPKLAYDYSLREAIRDRWLVPIVVARLPCGVDLRDIKTTGGDFSQAELEAKIAPHVESLSDIVLNEIGTRQTVIFTPDVGSAEATADAISKLSDGRVVAKVVSGRMTKEKRRETLQEFHAFGFQVIVCCDLLIEGWDCPQVSCVVIMRPTRQRSRYVQMIGRGTRPYGAPGVKNDVLVIDFAWETTSEHELVTSIELFDDSHLDPEVYDIAKDLVASGKERDPMKAIDEAEEIHREQSKFKVQLTGKRTSYKKIVFDPVGIGSLVGVPINRGWDFNPANPATQGQIDALKRQGVLSPEGISRTGAGKILNALRKRGDANLATIKQVNCLAENGMDLKQARAMSFADASAQLDLIFGGDRRAG